MLEMLIKSAVDVDSDKQAVYAEPSKLRQWICLDKDSSTGKVYVRPKEAYP